jgi:CubicO group peptidase (beta-lactamase class C family)
MPRPPFTAAPNRSQLLVALSIGVMVATLGVLARPQPPTLSHIVSGDVALAERARPYLEGALDKVSIAMIDGDTVTFAHFGATNDTEYEIGSVTKTFTSLLFADAIQRGEVAADSQVSDFLALADYQIADTTLADLASHRSGLSRQSSRMRDLLPMGLRLIRHRDPFTHDVDTIVKQAGASTLTGRGQFGYSNLGTALLGQALAVATGTEYAQLVEQRILAPLGMTATSVPVRTSNLSDGAPTGFTRSGDAVAPWTLNAWAPAGGIRSTPADMVRYAQALLDGSAPGIDAMNPRFQFGDLQIGYAWITEEIDGRGLIWHNGETGGFASMFILDPSQHRAVIVLSNTAASVDDVGRALIGAPR